MRWLGSMAASCWCAFVYKGRGSLREWRLSFCCQRRLVAFTVRKLFLPPQVNTTTFPFPKGIYGCVNAWSGCHGVTALQPVELLWL